MKKFSTLIKHALMEELFYLIGSQPSLKQLRFDNGSDAF